jgi:hypothetical protein
MIEKPEINNLGFPNSNLWRNNVNIISELENKKNLLNKLHEIDNNNISQKNSKSKSPSYKRKNNNFNNSKEKKHLGKITQGNKFLVKKPKKKENIIKKIAYCSDSVIIKEQEFKHSEQGLKPTILKECDNFISKTLMEKMHQFKYTFTDNLSNKINIKEALKKLKHLDDNRKDNNDFIDEIFSTNGIIENYHKNKINIKIKKEDKFAELRNKKTAFYRNLANNEHALEKPENNYFVNLYRNKLGFKLGNFFS